MIYIKSEIHHERLELTQSACCMSGGLSPILSAFLIIVPSTLASYLAHFSSKLPRVNKPLTLQAVAFQVSL